MSDTPDPSTPARDDLDAEDLGPSGAIGEGYPEESPEEVQPDGEPRNPRDEQPERDEG